MITEYDSLQVRPPWPDELPRLATFFPQEPLHASHLFVLAAPEPERLVGAAAVRMQADTAELRCRLRPRVLHERRGGPLLDAALAAARAQGVRRVVARLAMGAAEEGLLREHGFAGRETVERWRVDLEGLKRRLEGIPEGRKMRAAWIVRSPCAEDEAQLAGLFGSIPAERLRLREPEDTREGGLAPDISSVVVADGGELIGALLLRGSSSLNCAVDLCAVAPDRWSAPVAAALLRRCVGEALKEGYLSASLRTKDVQSAPEGRAVKNLLRRSGGEMGQRLLLLARELE
jgi:hypothetical protein